MAYSGLILLSESVAEITNVPTWSGSLTGAIKILAPFEERVSVIKEEAEESKFKLLNIDVSSTSGSFISGNVNGSAYPT